MKTLMFKTLAIVPVLAICLAMTAAASSNPVKLAADTGKMKKMDKMDTMSKMKKMDKKSKMSKSKMSKMKKDTSKM